MSVLPPGFPGRPLSDHLLRAIRHELRDIMDNKPAAPPVAAPRQKKEL